MKVFLLMVLVALATPGQAEDLQCENGDIVPDRYVCDGYCNYCIMCEDEEGCVNYGISKFRIGDLMAKMNLKKDGTGIGIKTENLPKFLWYCIILPVSWPYQCIVNGHCPTPFT